MYAMFSDDRQSLTVYHTSNQGNPDHMDIPEFVKLYGEDALPEITEPRAGDLISERSIPRPNEVLEYWSAFRKFVESCGEYARVSKLRKGILDGSSDALKVARTYYGDEPFRKLDEDIEKKMALQCAHGHNLSTKMRKVGYKPLSFAEDAKRYNDIGVSDTECLIRLFSDKEVRRRTYYRIDKYAGKVELRSPLEILKDVKKSFRENVPAVFQKPPS